MLQNHFNLRWILTEIFRQIVANICVFSREIRRMMQEFLAIKKQNFSIFWWIFYFDIFVLMMVLPPPSPPKQILFISHRLLTYGDTYIYLTFTLDCTVIHTLKKYSLLMSENNLSWVNTILVLYIYTEMKIFYYYSNEFKYYEQYFYCVC